MLYYVLIGLVVLVVVIVLVMLKLGGTIQADVYVAIEKGEFQFIALMDPDGAMIFPTVEGIPNWYLEVTGFMIRQTTPETREADLKYMQEYNQTMYDTLKEEGKLHLIEDDIATIRKNLGKSP